MLGVASLFGLGPAAACDLAALGLSPSLGLASGIGLSGLGCANNANQCSCAPCNYCNQCGHSGCSCNAQQCCENCSNQQGPVAVIARPVLPYFRSTSRGYPKW